MNSEEIARIATSGTDNDFAIVAVVMVALVLIVVPAILLDYRVKSRRVQAASASQDGKATSELWATARKMEERIGYLEAVLDTEVPGWRKGGVR